MGKVVLDSFCKHIIEPAWTNCFPFLLPQFPQLFRMEVIFYLLPDRGGREAWVVLPKCLGIPRKAMPQKGWALLGLCNRVRHSAVRFRL